VTVQAHRPYHHGNLRAALLERAEATVAERGAGALSLRELARELGVSHAAPSRHFRTKAALLDALAVDGWERFDAALRRAVEDAGEDFEARLSALGVAVVAFTTEHAALFEVMLAGKHGAAAEAAATSFATALEVITDGQARGEVVPGPPEEVGLVVWATVQGLAGLDAADRDAVVAGAMRRLVLGLRPR
jgi:AcrR family transcriptional regulator